jgi:AAA domain
MTSKFTKATKESAKIRLGIDGPSGSGKTYTGLLLGTFMAGTDRLAVIDTENRSASKYSDLFDFDTLALTNFHPEHYVEAIHDAEEAGYGALLIDSLSHAWTGRGGVLEMHDRAAAKLRGSNSWAAWRDVTPEHNKLVDALVQCQTHLIVTLRSKTEYVQERDSEGKATVRRVGMAPIQRDGLEYEFDVFGSMDIDNRLVIVKTRCPAVNGQVYVKPDESFGTVLLDWVTSGISVEERLAKARAEYDELAKSAKKAAISAKPLPDNATAPQIERWIVLLKNRVAEIDKAPAEQSA